MANNSNTPSSQLIQHFHALDQLLTRQRHYWQLRPFAEPDLPWRRSNPGLCQRLDQLALTDLEMLDKDSGLLQHELAPYIDDCDTLSTLENVNRFSKTAQLEHQEQHQEQPIPAWLGNHIPGRKWQQVQAFEQALPASSTNSRHSILEWCAGKGHLGRLLAFRRKQAIVSLEIDPRLCADGQKLARGKGLNITFIEQDAMAEDAIRVLQPDQHAMALHACGDLHLRLIQHACTQQTSRLSLSPCCYHLIAGSHYQPLSLEAKKSRLRLDHHDLRLPLQETVTAPTRLNALRRQEVCWRLGFDRLQRDLRRIDQYLNTPNIPKGLLRGNFESYCQWVGERKQLKIPATTDFEHYRQAGEQHYPTVQRIELVRHLYRRALELWLVLDRAIYLQEQGYRVEVTEFCERTLTPRNLLINAIREQDRTTHPRTG